VTVLATGARPRSWTADVWPSSDRVTLADVVAVGVADGGGVVP